MKMKMWKERSANIMLGAFLGIAMLLIILATICNHDKVSFEHLQKVEPDSVEKMADGGSVVELTLDERLKKRTTVAFLLLISMWMLMLTVRKYIV